MRKRLTTTLALLLSLACLASCAGGGSVATPVPTDPPAAASPLEPPAPTATPASAESPAPTSKPTPAPTSKPTPVPTAKPTPVPTAKPTPAAPLTDGEIIAAFTETITALRGSVTLSVGGREWKYGAECDLKNLYYAVLSDHPELKYAYDMTATVSGDSASCTFLYMPYKLPGYVPPKGSHTVGSLHDADAMAQSMLRGGDTLSIALTEPSLTVDELQRALGQAGYGWIVYTLSRDGTEIQSAPATGYTMAQCREAISESFRLAQEALSGLLTEGMTQREKAQSAYDWLVGGVAYDFRYYSGKNDMPFTSTVALGALRDKLAICGGYAHALETLLDLCGIENYTVSGVSHGEYHAWNYVVLDGEGYYCDPTADRGGMSGHFLLTAEELTQLGGYQLDDAFCRALRVK
jgi:hypothetical protein